MTASLYHNGSTSMADACCEDRVFPEAPALRQLAFQDLDQAFSACLLNKLTNALNCGSWLHPLTVTAWNTLVAKS